MNLHVFDNISLNSNEIREFESILKHTFYFNLDETMESCKSLFSKSNDTEIIDKIFEECDTLCNPIFPKKSFRFFGFPRSEGPDQFSTLVATNPSFWKTAIKYHCVVSSLFTLLHNQLNGTIISRHAFINDVKHFGYFSLFHKNILYIDKNTSYQIKNLKNENSTTRSEKSSHFIKLYRSLCNNLYDEEMSNLNMDKKSSKIPLIYSDLIYQLYNLHREGGIYKKFHQFYQEKDKPLSCNDYFEASQKLKDMLNIQEETDIVDQILLEYKAERFYNLSLTYCVIKSLLDFSHKQDILTLDSFPLEILELVFRLPNTFSRNDFFVYALHSFSNNYLSDSIFNNRHKNLSPFVKHKTTTPDRIRLITWLPLFQQFVLFFATLVFPLYEKCFLLLLMKSATKTKSGNSYTSNIISLLHDYISNHAQDLYENGIKTSEPLPNFRTLKISQIDNANKLEMRTLDLLTKKILVHQNNIFHSVSYPDFSTRYFGFTSSTKESHYYLMQLLIDSILKNAE